MRKVCAPALRFPLSRYLLAAVVGLGLAPVGACQPPDGPSRSAARVTDPQRIVAVAPSVTETLFALGLEDRIAAVGDYSSWPPEAAQKPQIGGLFNPRLEEIVALKPDLAVLVPSEERLAGYLERLGVETLVVSHETLEDIEQSIERIAARTEVENAGRRLLAEFRGGLEPRKPAGMEAGPKVLLVVAREPGRLGQVTAVGSGTFLAELAERLAADNVFAEIAEPYPQVGLEEILARGPEVIIELQPEPLLEPQAAALVADWSGFPQIPAVASGCLRVVGGGHVLLPGPRLPRLMRELEEALAGCGASS